MKLLTSVIISIWLVGCGSEPAKIEQANEEPMVIETFELPPIPCEISFPGIPPMVVVVPWEEAGDFESTSEYIDCRFPGEDVSDEN